MKRNKAKRKRGQKAARPLANTYHHHGDATETCEIANGIELSPESSASRLAVRITYLYGVLLQGDNESTRYWFEFIHGRPMRMSSFTDRWYAANLNPWAV